MDGLAYLSTNVHITQDTNAMLSIINILCVLAFNSLRNLLNMYKTDGRLNNLWSLLMDFFHMIQWWEYCIHDADTGHKVQNKWQGNINKCYICLSIRMTSLISVDINIIYMNEIFNQQLKQTPLSVSANPKMLLALVWFLPHWNILYWQNKIKKQLLVLHTRCCFRT